MAIPGAAAALGLVRAAAPRAATLAARGVQTADSALADSLAAAKPLARHLSGTFWSWVVPIAIFVLAAVATLALYFRFARERDALDAAARARDLPER